MVICKCDKMINEQMYDIEKQRMLSQINYCIKQYDQIAEIELKIEEQLKTLLSRYHSKLLTDNQIENICMENFWGLVIESSGIKSDMTFVDQLIKDGLDTK